MDMTALFLSRLQFAFTVSFHIIFPSLTIGLAAWLTVLEASHLASGRSLAVSFLVLHDSLRDHHRPSRCAPFQPGVHVLGRRSLRIPSHAGLHGDQLSRLSGQGWASLQPLLAGRRSGANEFMELTLVNACRMAWCQIVAL
jgi:Cytochrome bd terminal oxidase subunit I